ncbi:S4 domain-containing protein, partial [Pseudomonas paracarnis]|uniref:S4 domain-containing protein n=1 Tax=Pseudomonas paracarnis TaxID=2750625 RepID=UPI002938DAA4
PPPAPAPPHAQLVSTPQPPMWRTVALVRSRGLYLTQALRADVEAGANPRDVKIKLAEEIVARFHGEEAAANAHRAAGNRMKDGELPDDLPEIELTAAEAMPIAAVLNKAGLVKNSAVARDLLGAGGVRIDGEVVDRTFIYELGATHVCQAGKKAFARITLKSE